MGNFTTPFGRKITVNHSLGATYLRIEGTDTGESISTRLDVAQAKQLAAMLLDAAEPQKFYLKLFDNKDGFVNKGRDDWNFLHVLASKHDTSTWQTQFTQEEIDSDPELKKFEVYKVTVPAEEATD